MPVDHSKKTGPRVHLVVSGKTSEVGRSMKDFHGNEFGSGGL